MLGSTTRSESGVRVSSRILDRYVLDAEDVVVATRQHWARLAEPVLAVVLGFVAVSWLSAQLEPAVGTVALALWWLWLALVARLVWRLLEWRNEWFVATDKRLLLTYGLFTHKVAMMPLRKVTDLNYGRSVPGRLLGYGTFVLESAGQDQAMREINWLPDPDDSYRAICETIFGPAGSDVDDGPDPWLLDEHPHDRGERRPGRPSPAPRPDADDDPGWQVSSESASPAVRVAARARRRPVEDDPDITGPIPRPRR